MHPIRSPVNIYFNFCLQLAAPLKNIIFAAWYILCKVYIYWWRGGWNETVFKNLHNCISILGRVLFKKESDGVGPVTGVVWSIAFQSLPWPFRLYKQGNNSIEQRGGCSKPIVSRRGHASRLQIYTFLRMGGGYLCVRYNERAAAHKVLLLLTTYTISTLTWGMR